MGRTASVKRRLGAVFVSALALGVAQAAHAGTTTYTYDALGRVVSVNNADGNGVITTYTYDAAGNRISQTVNMTLPIAQPVTAHINEDSVNTQINLNIIGATPSSVAVPSGPSHGTYNVSGISITYTPTTNYVGSDSLLYTATNANGTSQPALISITVVPVPPTAQPVGAQVNEDSVSNPISLVITGPPATSVGVVSSPQHGTYTVSGSSITYTPTTGYVGSDTFQYTASNNAGTSPPALITVTVVLIAPIVSNINQTIAAGSSNNPINTFLIAPVLSGGAPTSIQAATQPSHGSASNSGTLLTYTPASGFPSGPSGTDAFTYTATNSAGTSNAATVNLTVQQGIGIWGQFQWGAGVW